MDLATWATRIATPAAALPSYRQDPSPLRRFVTKAMFYVFVVAVGLFYGLSVVVLPPILLLYISFPVLLLIALILWAMPDSGEGPLALVTLGFFGFSLTVLLWPDYVAMQVPDFARISFRRLWSWELAACLLLCLSMSSAVRNRLRDRMAVTRPFWIMAGLYFAGQWLTVPFSTAPFASINISLNLFFVCGIPLLAATYLCDSAKSLRRWEILILLAALGNCLIAAIEVRNGEVPWANHIPSFLSVDAETLQGILAGNVRDGKYRAASVFTVSLCLAEFLSVAAPFALGRALATNRLASIALWIAVDLILLGAIALTRSRLGIIGWLVSHAVFVLLWGWKRWSGKARDLVGPAVSLAFPLGASALLVAMFTVPAVRNRTIAGGSTGLSDMARRDQFELFWPKFISNPIGHGSGQSGVILDYHQPGGKLSVDSYFITTGIDYGVIGLICFFGMFLYTFYLMGTAYLSSDSEETDIALPIACAIAVLFIVRMVLSQGDNLPLIFMVWGTAIAVYARLVGLPRRAAVQARPEPADASDTPRLAPAE
ncbi:hypothetical protein GON01_06990 [Sphingomonas sp. MAH-20]|uniref:O-antigen ligase-related domain-containing protein n=1 Tax=Sphingomonas horti TaxID=2682842 RepID=A0A6I4IZI4_9SPHN|nr:MULTISPECIES: O-antigen ligase family protein [Sphingomonas]MBA2920744.1 O-antigen ligase family protein [Sphingomonas sp. CGMCC 1.13658]MVO77680.1 hypothetical protein [Sphingomonas horti]